MKLVLPFLLSTVAADLLPWPQQSTQSLGKPAGCPAITCVMFCAEGLQKDEKGCDKCSCAHGSGKLASGIPNCKRDANGCCSELGMAWCPGQNMCLSTSADAVVKCQSWPANVLSASAPRPQVPQQQFQQQATSTQTFPAPIQLPTQQANFAPQPQPQPQPQAPVAQQTFFQPIPKQLPPIPTQQFQSQPTYFPSAQQAQPTLTYFPSAQQGQPTLTYFPFAQQAQPTLTYFPSAQQPTSFPPAQNFFASGTNFAQFFPSTQSTNFAPFTTSFPASNSLAFNYLPSQSVPSFVGQISPAQSGVSAGSLGLQTAGNIFSPWTNFPAAPAPFPPAGSSSSTPTGLGCPEAMCMMYCENGFVKDARGCDTCSCAGSTSSGISPSGKIAGSVASPWNNVPATTLPAAPLPSTPPAGSSSSTPAGLGCPEMMCMMFCENGFVKDARGCDTCSCAGSSSSSSRF